MDPKKSAQDALRCYLCETPNPQYYCDICHINLCKRCAGEHLLDESSQHKIVPIRQRGHTFEYPYCLMHTKKQCELHCEQCDIPICTQCVSSNVHLGHKAIDIMIYLWHEEKNLRKRFTRTWNISHSEVSWDCSNYSSTESWTWTTFQEFDNCYLQKGWRVAQRNWRDNKQEKKWN